MLSMLISYNLGMINGMKAQTIKQDMFVEEYHYDNMMYYEVVHAVPMLKSLFAIFLVYTVDQKLNLFTEI